MPARRNLIAGGGIQRGEKRDLIIILFFMPGKKNTIYEAIKQQARKYPNKPALMAPHGAVLSYEELSNNIDQIKTQLHQAGIRQNSRIAIILPRETSDILINLSVSSYATAAPLSSELSAMEYQYLFRQMKIKALITDSKIAHAAVMAARKLNIKLVTVKKYKKQGTVELIIPSGTIKHQVKPVFPGLKDAAFILHTSGTTAQPKIVALTQANIYYGALNIIKALKLTAQDKCLSVMPLYHVHGLMVMIATIFSGGTFVYTPKFDRNDFFQWLDEFKPTWYTASAALQFAILSRVESYREIIKKQNLRFIRSSSAPLGKDATLKLEKYFRAPVAESYGMTEASLQITSQPLPPAKRKLGSVGKPTGVELAVMDGKLRLVPPGKTGEIIIKGNSIITAYENSPSVNKSSFHKGWLGTGDLGYADKDGFVFIKGRIKEMINKGGENISPREIDEALLRFPGVEQAAAFSLPHPELGEDIGVAVVLKKGIVFSENKIREFLKGEIAGFKIPSHIIVVKDLPKTGTGKIKRAGLYVELNPFFKKKYKRPKKDIEKIIIKIWSEVLDIPENEIGVEDNYFELGGDSLKISEVAKRFQGVGMDIAAKEILNNPTIKKLTAYIS